MKDNELYKWAVNGLQAEIDKLENQIVKGKQYLAEYEKGGKPKTPKTPQEIQEIIKQKKSEIEELNKKRFELTWKMEQ